MGFRRTAGRLRCSSTSSTHLLIKAALAQGVTRLFDKETKTSLGLERCLRLASGGAPVRLRTEEAGAIRALDAMRDAEQHWLITVSEDLMFLHVRALVTVFDDVMKRVFEEGLADHLPTRVLPLSSRPPAGLDVIIDQEFSQIADLLKPGRRQRDEARGRVRALLAMESHASDDEVRISEADIDRIEKAVKNGKSWREIFPKLGSIRAEVRGVAGEAIELRVHFTKAQGAPVKYTDDPNAAAYREIDMQKRFHLSATQLAQKTGVTVPMASAMKNAMKLERKRSACTSSPSVRRSTAATQTRRSRGCGS